MEGERRQRKRPKKESEAPSMKMEEVRRLRRVLSEDAGPAHGIFAALKKVRAACTEARSEEVPNFHSEYVALLGMALRRADLSPEQEAQVLSWMREAADVDDQRRLALVAANKALSESIDSYRELQEAVTVLMDPCWTERARDAAEVRGTNAVPSAGEAAPISKHEGAEAVAAEAAVDSVGHPAPSVPDHVMESSGDCRESAAEAGEGMEASKPVESVGSSREGALPLKLEERLPRLVTELMSPAVQLQRAAVLEEVPETLSGSEVAAVFKEHVPGVDKFVYRGEQGNYSLNFMQMAYSDGLRAFEGTDVHRHLLWLMRLIVHHGREKKPGAARYLKEVAEAFMDCQAVQGRTIERVGLQIRGVSLDLRGHLVRMVGDYKDVAVKMLALEECTKLGGPDDWHDPPHYENRIVADVGDKVGLNKDHIRQARLDEHAAERFMRLDSEEKKQAIARLRSLFDCAALLKAITSELNKFNADTGQDALPKVFLDWAGAGHLTQKHVVFDEESCTRVEVGGAFVLALLEHVFLGRVCCPEEESYRGSPLAELFQVAPEVEEEAAETPALSAEELRQQRLRRLKCRLLSPAVRVPEPSNIEEVAATLSDAEVAKVFQRHVPGVDKLIYRQQAGNPSMNFIKTAYKDGLRAFSGTDLHKHLLWLMRLIVHYGHEDKPGAAKYLKEVAEAFTDCQAVQGRVIERIGLQIQGVSLDFPGHLVRLAGEYKAVATKMLAIEECTKLGGPDDINDPAHYENRIINDLGEGLGLNVSHMRQAKLDSHAHSRFQRIVKGKLQAHMARFHELFDMEAWLKAFVAEASTLAAESEKESLPRLFVEWASEKMKEKHVILDEESCSRVEVGDSLALAIAEVVFLGKPWCSPDEEYRGSRLMDIFVQDENLIAEVAKMEKEARESSPVPAEKPAARAPWRGAPCKKGLRDEEEEDSDEGSEDSDEDEDGDLFDDDEDEDDDESEDDEDDLPGWEVDLGSHWARFDPEVLKELARAEAAGERQVFFNSRGWAYILDIDEMVQINLQTDTRRRVRRLASRG